MNKKKILILESQEKSRKRLTRYLLKMDLPAAEASSFSEANQHLDQSDHFAVVVVGLLPFAQNYIKHLKRLRKTGQGLGIVLLSEIENPELAFYLLDRGIVDHIASYENPAGILSAIKSEFSKRELIEQNEFYRRSLDALENQQKSTRNKASHVEEIYEATLENLMTALDLRDVETFGHSRTVSKYSLVLAKILGIKDKETLNNIKKGALLHDVGKIAIPDSILKKPSTLSAQEWEKIRLHPSLGYGLIKEVNAIEEIGNIILYHHERFDGAGYPRRLKKHDIPLEARIFALADALDAITSHRPYRKERGFDAAQKEIQRNSGTQFDPQVVEAFSSLNIHKWEKIRFETTRFMPSADYISQITDI
jgi:response regulator RpfG family c-di-GMP phosphodiesterase